MTANFASGVLLPGFIGTTLPGWVEARLRDGLAGVCLFGDNIESLPQLQQLTAAILEANPRAVIAMDEEGGDVTRLFSDVGSPYPGNAILGRIDDLAYTEEVAADVGHQLRQAGCTMTFGPDVDINSNPDNPVIGVRSFGADPELVARHSVAWVRGVQSAGIAVSAKHFPGHGDTAQDSHLALPVVDVPLDTLTDRELVPFRAVIEADAASIMTSHILLPQLDPEAPATLSPRILQELLRGGLGYQGVIVTDALDMAGASAITGIPEAAVRAIAAGCDLLCIGTDNSDEQLAEIEQAISSAIAEGRLDAARLADAAERTHSLAVDYAIRRAASAPPGVPTPRFDLTRTADSFEVTSSVSVAADRHQVVLEMETNLAVGIAPWVTWADQRISAGTPLGAIPPGRQLVLIGRDNHRHQWVRELIDEARREHPAVIVVDMGWPGDDRAYTDIATFGASAHVAEALLAWFERAAGLTTGSTMGTSEDGTE
ncbi:MAG: glycoside hydrolase family 3 N-terminal domain-containing protein [Homoserinimonas sp.]